jgi:hypothetical protein
MARLSEEEKKIRRLHKLLAYIYDVNAIIDMLYDIPILKELNKKIREEIEK